VSNQHKLPILAFVVLACVAAAIIGNQFQANAERSSFIAAGPIAAHSARTQGVIPPPDQTASPVAGALSGRAAPVLLPQGGPRRPGTVTARSAASTSERTASPQPAHLTSAPADGPAPGEAPAPAPASRAPQAEARPAGKSAHVAGRPGAGLGRSHAPGQLKKQYDGHRPGHSARQYAPGHPQSRDSGGR
jgi:hypothetical protein